MSEIEIKNAVIQGATLSTSERGLLTSYLHLDYGGSGQGFGGYALYLPRSWLHHDMKHGFAGHFIFRVMEIADVDEWAKLKGRTIRAKASFDRVHAIGHIVKDDWFNPSVDFGKEAA